MSNAVNFWDIGPHSPLPVEKLFIRLSESLGDVSFLMFYLEIHHLKMLTIHSWTIR